AWAKTAAGTSCGSSRWSGWWTLTVSCSRRYRAGPMLTLTVQVPEVRDRTALAALRSGLKTIATGPAVASAIPAIAAHRGTPAGAPLRPGGNPALGGSRLLLPRATRPDQSAEYGGHFLLFEPVSGAALSAESYGRLGLLAYGGAAGRDRR